MSHQLYVRNYLLLVEEIKGT